MVTAERTRAYIEKWKRPETQWTRDENALRILEMRYLKKKGDGTLETPEDMFWRVAVNIALVDLDYNVPEEDAYAFACEVYDAMCKDEWLPNSPTLMNAGLELQQLSACFVIPIEDSLDSIMDAAVTQVNVQKSGGGTGFYFGNTRPEGDIVRTTNGVASGPVSWLQLLNSVTHVIKQGGTRRGANMGTLQVTHPDIMKFISCKGELSDINQAIYDIVVAQIKELIEDILSRAPASVAARFAEEVEDLPRRIKKVFTDNQITNFNISVLAPDWFMKKALGEDPDPFYDLINPRTNEKQGRANAVEVFEAIKRYAHLSGDPGIIFIDAVEAANPTPHVGHYTATNPCGEQPLLPYEACVLSSINLAKCVDFTDPEEPRVDFAKIERLSKMAQHFLDNVIDAQSYADPRIEEMHKSNRKTGNGVMGWADMLVSLGYSYASPQAVNLGRDIMRVITTAMRDESVRLGKERGSFPNFKGSIHDGVYPTLRNATSTTIAPTGTISMIAKCSSGIEPKFGLGYVKEVMDGTRLLYIDPQLENALENSLLSEEEQKAIKDYVADFGVLPEFAPKYLRDLFVTAMELSPKAHVEMQAAFQRWTDNAVSKTINLPETATADDIGEIYELAWRLRCKGITIYRNKSKVQQVLYMNTKKDRPQRLNWTTKPEVLEGKTVYKQTPLGSLRVTLNWRDGELYEILPLMGKNGTDVFAFVEALGRLCSRMLQNHLPVEEIIHQLRGIGGSRVIGFGNGRVTSVPDAIAQILEEHGRKHERIPSNTPRIEIQQHISPAEKTKTSTVYDLCSSCGQYSLERTEGCLKCVNCGFSAC